MPTSGQTRNVRVQGAPLIIFSLSTPGMLAALTSAALAFSAPRRAPQRLLVRAGAARMSSLTGGEKAKLSLTPPTAEDVRVIEERQLGHRMSNIVGVGGRCKHGYPQAFAFDPIDRVKHKNGKWHHRKSRIEGGMFRLSCPLLVKAVDEWEAQGAVREVNAEVEASVAGPQPDLVKMLDEAHAAHAAARHVIIGERLSQLMRDAEADGPQQLKTVRHVLSSGVAGQTRSKADIKCVHAQLADGLCRSNSNDVANVLMDRLTERGAQVRPARPRATPMPVPRAPSRASVCVRIFACAGAW